MVKKFKGTKDKQIILWGWDSGLILKLKSGDYIESSDYKSRYMNPHVHVDDSLHSELRTQAKLLGPKVALKTIT